MLTTFKEFVNDEKAAEMFVSGQAGTGKTTGLFDLVQFCIDNSINYVVCAYTHKACGILRSKLPKDAIVVTLHKYLKKRPTVNEHALKVKHIQNSKQQGVPEEATIIMIDEYSMLGEADYSDIGDRQWLEGTNIPNMKALYIGDPNQLGPIDGPCAIYPSGKYNVKLTKIYRQAGDNPLLDTLTQLVTFIEGAPVKLLKENTSFERNLDLHAMWNGSSTKIDKVFLAWTNEKVQYWNALLEGKDKPEHFDEVASPTTKQKYTYLRSIKRNGIAYIDLPFGDEPLAFGTKFKTLEHLISMEGISYASLEDEEEGEHTVAYVFGHYDYKIKMEELGKEAVAINKQIEDKHKMPAKVWAHTHKSSVLARKRAKAWRDYFTFKNCVICLDFPYAMTVHKSQGSTYDTVFLDTQDLGQCAAKDYQAYLKLMYVAISRASNKVYTN